MSTVRVVLGVLTGAVLATLLWQRHVQVRLRQELSALHEQNLEAVRLHQEQQQLKTNAVSTDELRQLRADLLELTRLRGELAALKSETKPFTKKPLGPGMMSIEALRNAGVGTAADAAQTFFWATTQADTDALAKTFVLEGVAREKIETWLARLEPSTREKFGSPNALVAVYTTAMYSRIVGVELRPKRDVGPDEALWNAHVQTQSGNVVDWDFRLRRSADGWHWKPTVGFIDEILKDLSRGQ